MTWKKIKLKKLLSQPIQNGYSPVCPETPNGKWILGLGALNGISLDINEKKPAPLNDEKVDNFLLRSGDFLVSRSNTLDKVGRAALFKGEIENCSYPDLMMRFRIDSSRVFPEFLENYLKGFDAVLYFQRSASGTSGSMVKINKGVLENLLVPIPPILEQKLIAGMLKIWQETIEKIERLIAAKEKRYRWLLNRLISANNRTYGQIRDFTSEISKRNRDGSCDLVLSVTNHSGFVLPEEQFERRVASSDLRNYKVVLNGQYAYNPSRINVGSIARLDSWEQGVLSPMYVVFKINEKIVISDFFLHWLSSHEAKERIRNSAQGSVRETVSFADFGAIPFPLPAIEQQQEIAEVLNTAKQEINLLKKLAEFYRKQKRGLMQKLLTGQWRVKTGEGIES